MMGDMGAMNDELGEYCPPHDSHNLILEELVSTYHCDTGHFTSWQNGKRLAP